MKNVIYIPLPDNNEALKNNRKELAQEFIDDGWKLDGTLPLTDAFGTKVDVIVLTKPIL